MARKKTKQVESLKHRDKGKNIPTEELRDFVAEDEQKPSVVLYTRAIPPSTRSSSGRARTSRTPIASKSSAPPVNTECPQT